MVDYIDVARPKFKMGLGSANIENRKQCLVNLFPKIQVAYMADSQNNSKPLRDIINSMKEWLGKDHRPGKNGESHIFPKIYFDH